MSSTNRGAQRHPDDWYRTPAWAVAALIPELHFETATPRTVLDPCGEMITIRNPKLKNYKQALAIAQMRGGPGLCHQCSSAGEENEEFALSDGIDGDPDGLVAEEDE